MTLTGPNRLRAVRAAQEILEQFSVSVLPVDVDAIAAELGISVMSEQLPLDIYGATAHDGVSSRILISTTCFSPGHRRFTLAHEIGHFCIGGHAEHLFSRGKGLHHSGGAIGCRRDPIEVEADAFAAELLMPTALTTAAAAAEGVGIAMVRAVATVADVSMTAAAIRASELRISLDSDPPFRSKPITHFGRSRSPISLEGDHRFRRKPIMHFAPSRSPFSPDLDHVAITV